MPNKAKTLGNFKMKKIVNSLGNLMYYQMDFFDQDQRITFRGCDKSPKEALRKCRKEIANFYRNSPEISEEF